jgi:hypothetical protein|tara:strand:- start:541 stop:744 length:204 start_codon:yes stop_codon:yes gene_type:complete
MTQQVSAKQTFEKSGVTTADFERFSYLILEIDPMRSLLLQNIILERQKNELEEKIAQMNGVAEGVEA